MDTWEIPSITSVPKFLAAIAQHLPQVVTVSFEIHKACSEARQIYARYHSPVQLRPARDTISPKTDLHYCVVSQALADELEGLLRRREIREVLWHVKGFGAETMLFGIHDADCGDAAFLSPHIDGKVVAAIASFVGRQAHLQQSGYDWNKSYRRSKGR